MRQVVVRVLLVVVPGLACSPLLGLDDPVAARDDAAVVDAAGAVVDAAGAVVDAAAPGEVDAAPADAPADDADMVGPTIVATTPALAATGVQPEVVITAALSEDPDPTSLAGAVTVRHGGTAVAGTVTAEGRTLTFAPARPLRNPATFSAEVTGVRDLAGNVMAPHTWTFTTRDKAWQSPVRVETADAGSVTGARVAMTPEGAAVAVFTIGDGTRDNTVAGWYRPGAGWAAAEPIESSTVGASTPRVCLDGSGNAVAVWSQGDVRANRYLVNGGWQGATPVEARPGPSSSLAVACQLDGRAMAVWLEETTPPALMSSLYDPRTGWRDPEVVATATGSLATIAFRDVVATRSEAVTSFHTVWSRSDSSPGIHMATYYGGPWLAQRVDTTSQSLEPRIGIGLAPPAVTAWSTSSSSDVRAGIGPDATGLETSATGTFPPALAVRPDGSATVIWSFVPDRVVAARWTTTAWTAPEDVDTTALGGLYAAMFQVAAGPDAVFAAWARTNLLSTARITVTRRANDGAWEPALEVAPSAFALPEDLAVDGEGNAIVLYRQTTSGRDDLWAAHYR